MILITHAIVGASVAQLFPNHPIIGFLAGATSHYLSDTVPHWDYAKNFSSIQKINNGRLQVLDKIVFGPRFLLESFIVLLDSVLGLVLAWLIWYNPAGGNLWLLILGAIGGMLPDYLQIVYGFWKNKFTIAFQKFHSSTHTPDKLKIKNIGRGILSQTLFVILVVIIVSLIG